MDLAGPTSCQASANPPLAESNANETQNVTERVMKSVPPPPWHFLTTEELYNGDMENNKPNIQRLQKHLFAGGLLSIEHAMKIIQDATEIMREEACCLDLWAPLVCVGDLHGQLHDLVPMLEREFKTTEDEGPIWLFLGDYVDRGFWGMEICLLLFAMKIAMPRKVYLLRGNHESRVVTTKFNFREECLTRYNEDIYVLVMDAFDCLPLAATIGTDKGTYFAVHGGLSPEIDSIDDINSIDRFREIPRFGPICDLTWSDPLEEDTALRVQPKDMWEWWNVDFCANPTRGIGQVYGYAAITQFLSDNCLIGIIRAHEVAREGYTENWMCKKEEDPKRTFPYVVTVFSAPNYCGWYGNKAAIMVLNEAGDHEYIQFTQMEDPPFVLPKQMNAFSYSMPMLMEQVTKLLYNFCNLVLDAQTEANIDQLTRSRSGMRLRICSLSNATRVFHETNERAQLLIQLKGLYGGDLPPEASGLSTSNLQTLCDEYTRAKEIDAGSEVHPSIFVEGKPQTAPQENDGEVFWRGASHRTGLTPRSLGSPVKK